MPGHDYDVLIIGSGAGGGTLAYALRDLGNRVLLVERGGVLPQEPANWGPRAVFREKRYGTKELWEDSEGRPFSPGVNYVVGGNTKLFGASLPRFRRQDFEETPLAEGVSPAWPFSYDDIESHYTEAEHLYGVHGNADDDPDRAATPYPYPALPHEPYIAELAARLAAVGRSPTTIPLAIDRHPGGSCIRCATCDAFPCKIHAKGDAEVRCIRPAIAAGVELLTGAYAQRIETDPSGAIAMAVIIECAGERRRITAGAIVVSAGAVNSAALLLRSVSPARPNGVANSSDVVGRHYMVHNNTVMLTIDPRRTNPVVFQKTLDLREYCGKGTDAHPYPLGYIQLIGKVGPDALRGHTRWAPRAVLSWVARHSVDWWVFSEDLPDPGNRVTVSENGQIRITWRPSNVSTHQEFVRTATNLMRTAGFPIILTRRAGISVNSHQAGTVRAGVDPATSALDPWCRSHDVRNLFVVDSSFFPSLPVLNPALTIAANALRVADRVREIAIG